MVMPPYYTVVGLFSVHYWYKSNLGMSHADLNYKVVVLPR